MTKGATHRVFDIDPVLKAPEAWPKTNGLPRPDWGWIYDWVTAQVPETGRHETYHYLSDYWLTQLVSELGPAYRLQKEVDFYVVTSESESASSALVDHARRSIGATLELMPGVACDEGYGPHVMVVAGDRDTYYRYFDACRTSDESGEFGATGGVCIREGYSHVLLNDTSDWYRQSTITHEYAHVCLSHLVLPVWVEECIVQLITLAVTGDPMREISIDDVERQRAFLLENSTFIFWSGESFDLPDEGQELSYQLALWMVHDLLTADRDTFFEALKTLGGTREPTQALCDHMGIEPHQALPAFLRSFA